MVLNVLLVPDRLHLVAGGERHHARLVKAPQTGDELTMLCGLSDVVEFRHASGELVGVRTCWTCDLEYRRQHGIEVRPDHPGLTSVGCGGV